MMSIATSQSVPVLLVSRQPQKPAKSSELNRTFIVAGSPRDSFRHNYVVGAAPPGAAFLDQGNLAARTWSHKVIMVTFRRLTFGRFGRSSQRAVPRFYIMSDKYIPGGSKIEITAPNGALDGLAGHSCSSIACVGPCLYFLVGLKSVLSHPAPSDLVRQCLSFRLYFYLCLLQHRRWTRQYDHLLCHCLSHVQVDCCTILSAAFPCIVRDSQFSHRMRMHTGQGAEHCGVHDGHL